MPTHMKYIIIRIFQLLYQNRFILHISTKFLTALRVHWHLIYHLKGYLISHVNLYKKIADNIKQILYLLKITLTAITIKIDNYNLTKKSKTFQDHGHGNHVH